MAGDWLAIRLDLHDDPAVILISSILNCEQDVVVGKLVKLWSWANTHLHDGVAKGVTMDWVDRYVSAAGFAAAMIESGWLQSRSGSIHFPKFDIWNSESAKQRLLDTKRKQRKRAENDTCPVSVRNLSGSHPDKNGTRGEERREEERKVGRLESTVDLPPARPPAFASQAEEVAQAYQRRRYTTPDTQAKYYPVLVQEATNALALDPDAFALLMTAIEKSPLPQEASFSEIAKACGLKRVKSKPRAEPSPYKNFTAERLAAQMGVG